VTALDGRRGLGPPLYLLALDVDAALAAYGAALAGGDAGRVADTRATLGAAAAALASWCGWSVPSASPRPSLSEYVRLVELLDTVAREGDGTPVGTLERLLGTRPGAGRPVARFESHGERRSTAAPPYVLDGMRALAIGIAADVRCRVCDGSGLRSPCDMEPCRACAGAGVP